MTSEDCYPSKELNRVRRVAGRAHYDKESVRSVFDQAWFCHVGIVDDGQPTVIPMVHGRDGDKLLFHGSPKSRLMQYLTSGREVSIAATLFDGLVLARSLFHTSMNYRSVVAFGTGVELAREAEKLEALRLLSERLVPGRWQDARRPSAKELKATAVAAITLHSASAKTRKGGPIDDAQDMDGPHWAGIVSFRELATGVEPDENLRLETAVPAYVRALVERRNARVHKHRVLAPDGYQFVDRLDETHLPELCALYESEWWSSGRTLSQVERVLDGSSFIVGILTDSRQLVGFARVLSDGVLHAWVFDVIVKASHRGKGLGAALMERLMHHPDLEGVRRLSLNCREDMLPFYERWGFASKNTELQLRYERL